MKVEYGMQSVVQIKIPLVRLVLLLAAVARDAVIVLSAHALFFKRGTCIQYLR